MVTPNNVVFVSEALRDLLGLLRVMYAEEAGRENHSTKRTEKITLVANELKEALAIVTAHDPGTAPYERAVGKVDWVIRQMEDLFVSQPMPELVRVATRRVRGDWKPWKRSG